VQISQLNNAIMQELNRYAQLARENVEELAEITANEGATTLKSTSPQRSGKYAKSWRVKKVGTSFVIYNTKYQLTHLLEKGHAKVNGGRVAAIPHIRPVEQAAIEQFVNGLNEVLGG